MRTTVLALACLVLAACSPSPPPVSSTPTPSESVTTTVSPAPSPTGSPSPTPTEAPSVRPVLLGSLQIDSTGIVAEPTNETLVISNDDGSLQLRVRVPAGPAPTRLELHVQPDTVDTVVNGGLAVIYSRTGQALAAVPQPTARDAGDQPVPARMSVIDTTLVFQITPEERHSGEIIVDIWVGRRMIADVTVGEERGEPRFSITRTDFGHAVLGGGLAAQGARELFEAKGWEEALTLEPALATPPSIRQQFDCHVLGAPSKESWNLEAFRPDNPDWLLGALEHRCNWTDDDLPQPEPSESG